MLKEILLALVIGAILFLLVLNNTRYLAQLDDFGQRVRRFKYTRLVPWVGRLPFSANAITISRPFFIGMSLYCFHHEWTALSVGLYTLGWLTDYIDGIKAYAEQLEQDGIPSTYGKYWDPGMDMVSCILLGIILHQYYMYGVGLLFLGTVTLRISLTAVLVIGRRRSRHWRNRLNADVMDKTLTGEIKAAGIAVSFGLVLLKGTIPQGVLWSLGLLSGAILIEVVTLVHLMWMAKQKIYGPPQLKVIQSPPRTGTDPE